MDIKREILLYTSPDNILIELEGCKMKSKLINEEIEEVVFPMGKNTSIYRTEYIYTYEYKEVWNIYKSDRTTEVIEITRIEKFSNTNKEEIVIWDDFLEKKSKGRTSREIASEYGYILAA